jgi:ATP-dependent RNA helicase DDX18/HAS1
MQQGFEHELKRIVKLLPAERCTMLFSATLSGKVEGLAAVSLRRDKLVSVGVEPSAADGTESRQRNVATLVQQFS